MKFLLKSIFWLALLFYILGYTPEKYKAFMDTAHKELSQNVRDIASNKLTQEAVRHAVVFSPEKIQAFLTTRQDGNIQTEREQKNIPYSNKNRDEIRK